MEQNGAQQGQSLFESQLPGPLPTSAVSSTPQAFPFQDEHFDPKQKVVGILLIHYLITKNRNQKNPETTQYKYLIPFFIAHDSNDDHSWSSNPDV